MVHKESLSYDKTDPISIYEYALPLIDHTLREIVGDATVAGYNSKNKSELGQMVEGYYSRTKAITIYGKEKQEERGRN